MGLRFQILSRAKGKEILLIFFEKVFSSRAKNFFTGLKKEKIPSFFLSLSFL